MKFEQALKAMRRGEVVRRKGMFSCGLWLRDGFFHDKAHGGAVNQSGWSDDFILADDWVIVRKKKKAPEPTPPPRNIFKDPRVGDEFGNADCTWRVIGVSDYEVAYECVKIRGNPGEHLHLDTRDCFVTHQDGFATLTRVPTEEEVGSPDAK